MTRPRDFIMVSTGVGPIEVDVDAIARGSVPVLFVPSASSVSHSALCARCIPTTRVVKGFGRNV